MKLLYKHSISLILSLVGLIVFNSCEEGPNFRIQEYPVQSVTSFSPITARPTENITISGSNFGTLKGAVTVYFNGVATTQAEIVSVSDNQIVTKVPLNAASGKIAVKVWTVTNEIPGDFTFIPGAEVSSVSPAYGVEGGLVTITGKNFGTDSSIVKVIFGGDKNASIVSLTNTQIKVIIPVGAVTANFTVVVGNQSVVGGYFLVGEEKLAGTVIGTSGSYQNNPATTIAAGFDGDISTGVDGAVTLGWLGYDLGATVKAQIKRLRFYPKPNAPGRMTGVRVYGTNDLAKVGTTTADLLYTIPTTPLIAWNEVPITNTTSYRYMYFYFTTGFMNVAEIEFYGKKD